MHIEEPARQTPVAADYDVVVVGGGIAGVAAAVAAARCSVRVCLVERYCGVGGLATLGNVSIWLPLCDGMGRQVSGGLAEALLRLAVADVNTELPTAQFQRIPACWESGGDPAERRKRRFRAGFNPASTMLALEKRLVDAGVDILYDTRFCAVRQEAGRITHVIIENKSGRRALACRAVVDATGDADVCVGAGEASESLDSNVLCGWFYSLAAGKLRLHKLTNRYSPHATREGAQGPFFRGDDAGQVTAHILESRERLRTALAELRAKFPEEDPQLLMPPSIACFRMTRRLVGRFTLGERHVHQWFDDTIGLCSDWRRSGPVYAIPLGCLRAVHVRNLLAAGRCISVDSTAWDVLRAIPACAVTGEAAGTAAALAAKQAEGCLDSVDVADLQAHLRRRGVLLDPALTTAVGDVASASVEGADTRPRGFAGIMAGNGNAPGDANGIAATTRSVPAGLRQGRCSTRKRYPWNAQTSSGSSATTPVPVRWVTRVGAR